MVYLFLLLAFIAAISWALYAVTDCLAGAMIFGGILAVMTIINWWLCASAPTASDTED